MDFEEQTPEKNIRRALRQAMGDGDDENRPETILLRLSLIGILVPGAAAFFLWAWGRYTGHIFTNKEIRFLCLLIWLGTLFTLAVAAIGGRYGKRPQAARQLLVPLDGRAPTSLEKWEQRSARRLLYEAGGAAFAVPVLAVSCIYIWSRISGAPWNAKVVTEIAPFLWGGGLAAAAIVAAISTRRRLVYRRKENRAASIPASAMLNDDEEGHDF